MIFEEMHVLRDKNTIDFIDKALDTLSMWVWEKSVYY